MSVNLVRIVGGDRTPARARRASPLKPTMRPVPREFTQAVRDALRAMHEMRRLARNTLLLASLVVEQAAGSGACLGDRLAALQALLRDQVESLGRNARTDPLYRVLLHTYLQPAATQLLAADAARMSFGTYRRHLAEAVDELVTLLWLREDALGAQR